MAGAAGDLGRAQQLKSPRAPMGVQLFQLSCNINLKLVRYTRGKGKVIESSSGRRITSINVPDASGERPFFPEGN